jgi:dTMP kinase
MARGICISFEGGEGAGKSTQIGLLKSSLAAQGLDVVTTREPGGTVDAEALWQCFIDHKGQHWDVIAQAFLVFTTRRLHLVSLIEPSLAAGKVVITDRFTDSTRVYQGVAGGLGLDKIESIKQECIGDFEPDLTFIFDIDPNIGLARIGKRDPSRDTFEDKKLDFHNSLRTGYLNIARENTKRCVVIDATQSIEVIAKQIFKAVNERI